MNGSVSRPAFAPASVADDLAARGFGRATRRILFDKWIGRLLPLLFIVVVFPILDMIWWIAQNALPTMTWSTLTTPLYGDVGGLYGAILGTTYLAGLALAICGVLGIFGGMYTAEYASPRTATFARLFGNILAGTPAIVIGYTGYFLLVLYTGWGTSIAAGAITLSVFMLPWVFRTTDLAFLSVPPTLREASLGLGATHRQYLFRVGFPVAFPRILTGIFIALAIGVGETAPLIFTAGWQLAPATSLTQGTSYLTGLIWTYFDEPANLGHLLALSFQAAFILFIIVIGLNVVVQIIGARYRRRLKGLFA